MTSLQKRLNQIAARKTLRLTHVGRNSGKKYNVTIWFTTDGKKVYLTSGNVKRSWVKNVKSNPHVDLLIAGERFSGEARFLTDPAERDDVLAMLQHKYSLYGAFILLGRMLAEKGLLNRVGAFEVTLMPTAQG